MSRSNLFDKYCLKSDEHGQREETVVPVLVQAPQPHTEHLENKEWRRRSLLEERPEVGS